MLIPLVRIYLEHSVLVKTFGKLFTSELANQVFNGPSGTALLVSFR